MLHFLGTQGFIFSRFSKIRYFDLRSPGSDAYWLNLSDKMICCGYVGSILPSLVLSEFSLPLLKLLGSSHVEDDRRQQAMNTDLPLSNDPKVLVPVQNPAPTIRKGKRGRRKGSKKKTESTSGYQPLATSDVQ